LVQYRITVHHSLVNQFIIMHRRLFPEEHQQKYGRTR